MRLRGEQGQTGAEMAGVLLLVSLIVGALAATGMPATIAEHTRSLVCRIAGGDCDEPAAAADAPADPDGPTQGPILTDAPVHVLPFPGSITVSCTYSEQSEVPCLDPELPGVGIAITGEVEVERTPTRLDAAGCPQQTLSTTTSFELGPVAVAAGVQVGGALATYVGTATTYAVTVSPDAADAIEAGERPPPNPLDPTTIGAGEGVELSEEFYAGLGLDANYHALQTEMGYDEGRRVSAGVTRVDPSTIRVFVGDERFVRNAMIAGVGNEKIGVELGMESELSSGKLRAVDIDIATPEGWAAYQDFLATGELPASGTAGTSRHSGSSVSDELQAGQIAAHLGGVAVSAELNSSEGHVVETTNEDGSTEELFTARYNDVTITTTTGTDASGDPRPPSYSLLLQGVDESLVESYEHAYGEPLPRNGNLRFDFTAADLQAIRQQALEVIAYRSGPPGGNLPERPTVEEVEQHLADGTPNALNDGGQYWLTMIASADDPAGILNGLWHMGEADMTLQNLIGLSNDVSEARHGETGHPDTALPGRAVVPDCS